MLAEHPMNNFSAMDKRIYEQNIKVGVVDFIKNELQPAFDGLDQAFEETSKFLEPFEQTTN